MQNKSRFAEDVRNGVDELLDALASTDETRVSLLKVAGQWLRRAVDEAHTPEEKNLIDAIYQQWGEMRKNPGG